MVLPEPSREETRALRSGSLGLGRKAQEAKEATARSQHCGVQCFVGPPHRHRGNSWRRGSALQKLNMASIFPCKNGWRWTQDLCAWRRGFPTRLLRSFRLSGTGTSTVSTIQRVLKGLGS